MSGGPDRTPVPATPAEAAGVAPAPAPAAAPAAPAVDAVPGAPPSTPYRIPGPPPATPPPYAVYARARGPQPWPVIGPTLSVYAALLWSFVVFGQFATSWMTGAPLPQGYAFLMVFVATFVAWVASLRASRLAAPPRSIVRLFGRGFGIGALATLLFFFTILAVTIASFAAPRAHDFFFAFALVVLSLAAALIGPRLTWPNRPEGTDRQRLFRVVTWVVGTLLTLLAGAELAANG